MKKQLIYWLAAIALIATSCVEDDYAEDSRTPIQFTVSMAGNMATTRSAVDDIWNGGEAVAVQMTSGGSSIVKKYKIDNSESPVKLVPFDDSVQPFYWPHSGSTEVTVSAWYPYAETKQTVATTNTDIKDQSTAVKYDAANLMEAADVTHTYNVESPTTPFDLTFAHKMAKLIIVPYYYKNTLGEAGTSRLTTEDAALTTTKAINLCSGNNAITAYRNNRQFEVLVAPQAIAANTEIIQLSFGNSTFKYKSDAKTLEAGKTYTYNVNFNTAADSAISVTTAPTGNTLTYNGSSHDYTEYITISAPVTCNGKTLALNTDYEITGVTSATNAGTYTVTVRGKGQYSNNNTSSFTWTINKKDGILTAPTPISGISLGTSSVNMFDTFTEGSFKDGEVSVGTIYYGLSTSESTVSANWYSTRDDSAESPQLIAAPGIYYIWYKVVPDDNHKLSDSDKTNYVDTNGISKTPLSISITGSSE